jgi:DNA topoisomerase I
MSDARYKSTKVVVEGKNGSVYTFEANGKVMLFKGFLRVWNVEESDQILPEMKTGEKMKYDESKITEHFTTPPSRYNEASLISSLEKHGIGRPSTYAPTISTIEDRGYVVKKNSSFYPTYVGVAVVDLLKKHFSDYVNLEFTAKMEEDLDHIAEGKVAWNRFIKNFYFGDGKRMGLDALIEKEIKKIEYPFIPVGQDPKSKKDIVVRIGKTFPYLQRGDGEGAESTPLPVDLLMDELTVERALKLLESGSRVDEALGEMDGASVYVKNGPYGPYVQLGNGDEKSKPKRVSLPLGKSPADISLEYAKKLLSLPLTLGTDKQTGAQVKAGLGRFGPYVARGSQYASIKEADALFDMTLDAALAILNEKKGGKRLLRQLEKGVEVMDGKFGPYVTDGKKIAGVPKDKKAEKLTLEEAQKLLENGKEKPKRSRRKKK